MEQKTPAEILKELRNDLEIFEMDQNSSDSDDRAKAYGRAKSTREKIEALLKEHPELA